MIPAIMAIGFSFLLLHVLLQLLTIITKRKRLFNAGAPRRRVLTYYYWSISSRTPRISLTTQSAPASRNLWLTILQACSLSSGERASYYAMDNPMAELPSRIPTV